MSSDIHPDWHTTDDEEIVPVHEAQRKEEKHIPVHTTSVSRKPAAVMGILLVVSCTTLFYQGVRNLTGQLSGATEVRITGNGFNPPDIAVAPGGQIAWTNENQVPQYIISDTLCSPGGGCLNTPTMFQNDRASFTISADTAEGTYTYYSPTDPNLRGTITVGSNGPVPAATPPLSPDTLNLLPDTGDTNSVDAFSFAQQSLLESIQRQLALDEESQEETGNPTAENTSPTTDMNIPQNPYTVGSNREFPFDSEGNPIASVFGDEETPPVRAQVVEDPLPALGRSTQKPLRQPETGPGIWLIVSLSALGLWLAVRRATPVVRTR